MIFLHLHFDPAGHRDAVHDRRPVPDHTWEACDPDHIAFLHVQPLAAEQNATLGTVRSIRRPDRGPAVLRRQHGLDHENGHDDAPAAAVIAR